MSPDLDRLVDDFQEGRLSRRQLISHLVMAGVAMGGAGALAGAASPRSATLKPTFTAVGLNHLALAVTDIPRSRKFYEEHLGLTFMHGGERSCFMSCGRDWIAMFKSDKPGMDHYCYSINGYAAESAVESLKAAGLEPRRHGNRVYFDDPDKIEVQVAAPDHR